MDIPNNWESILNQSESTIRYHNYNLDSLQEYAYKPSLVQIRFFMILEIKFTSN